MEWKGEHYTWCSRPHTLFCCYHLCGQFIALPSLNLQSIISKFHWDSKRERCESSSVMKRSLFWLHFSRSGETEWQQWLYGIMLNRISFFCSFSSHKCMYTYISSGHYEFFMLITHVLGATTTSCSYLHHSINVQVHMDSDEISLNRYRGVKCEIMCSLLCVCAVAALLKCCMHSAAYKFGNCKKGNWRWKRENTEHT